MNTRSFVLLAAALSVSSAYAQPGSSKSIQPGKTLPTVSATAVSGKWLERAAFDPVTYGKVRGVSPANSSMPKIVLYTSDLTENFFNIAAAVDRYVASNPELAWSFVQLSDKKGAQRGGYTTEELQARIGEVQALVKKHGIKHLSFLIAAPGTGAAVPDPSVTIAYVRPSGASKNPYKSGTVAWIVTKPASDLQAALLSENITALDAIIRSDKSTATVVGTVPDK